MPVTPPFDLDSTIRALDPSRRPLVLRPSDDAGWFEGQRVVAIDPTFTLDSCTHARALTCLARAFESADPTLAVAVLPYDGPASAHVYSGAWLSNGSAWELFGDAPDMPVGDGSTPFADGSLLGHAVAELDERAFTQRVCQVQESILGGDVYVLNLTYRVRGVLGARPGPAFERLNALAPSRMSAMVAGPRRSVVSISPERFVSAIRAKDGSVRVAIEPIKGTAPRDPDPLKDAQLAAQLRASEKERAEHVMIVDLERNDLGRVCEPGSIHVDPLFGVFGTAYCHQMVSSVRGRLRADAGGVAGLLKAAFPCGSVTGAPKFAAMELIDELEVSARGVYTGALVVAMPGRLDSSIMIRTLEYRGGMGLWGTGCGITIDSDPVAEWDESVLKTWPVTTR